MKIFRADQVRAIDAYTIDNEPINPIDLMERAAHQLHQWITKRYTQDRKVRVIAGPGNNGGDSMALARMLADDFYNTEIYYIDFTGNVSDSWKMNQKRIVEQGKVTFHTLSEGDELPLFYPRDLLIDGLFGSGLSRPLKGFPAEIVRWMNQMGNEIIAIDVPSGLLGEDNSGNDRENIVHATNTLTFQFPSLSYFFAENESCLGNWHVLPIGLHPEIIDKMDTDYFFLTKKFVASHLASRDKFSHKGTFGHVLLISGCYGKMGAAVLASRACLRTGTGLLTAHIPKFGYEIMQTALPEAMISIDQSDIIFTRVPDLSPFQAIGIGPAVGCRDNSQKGLHELLEKAEVPLVIDADAINILGESREWLKQVPENTIFTPHPKEFERLAGKTSNHYERNRKQIEFSKKNRAIVVLKGAHTSISCPDGTCYFNTTGNPGMATAGSGDVLTGIILSLLGQGYPPEMAAIIGVYLHGLAGDLAKEQFGEEALIATDIIENLGNAFKEVRNHE